MPVINTQIPNSQRGFATILIVLLVGLAVAASALGTAYYIKTSQRTLVSSHALTNAQSGAWSGVEIFRKYLLSRSESDLTKLNGESLTLNVQGGRALSVNSITTSQVSTNPNIYRVVANVQNKSDSSEASSTIQVVYEVSPNSGSSSTPEDTNGNSTLTGAMNFYGGLTTTGDINLSNAGKKAIINVEGNVNKSSNGGGVSLTGVKRLNATGSVELASNTSVEEVYSNKFIIISGGASVTKMASALQYIRMNSGGAPNGDFIAGNSSKIATNAIKKEDVYVSIENSGRVNSINTLNKVSITGGGANIGTVIAAGKVNCPGTWWSSYTSMKASNFDSSCSTNNRSDLNGIQPLNAIEVSEISAESKPIVNALSSEYKGAAQYIIYFDSTDNLEKVNVQENINSSSATYTTYLLDKKNGFLCKTLNANKQCTTPVIKLAPQLKNQKSNFIDYDKTTRLWTVEESNPNWSDGASSTPSFVPSIVLFMGSLNLRLGRYTNTFLATDDITYGGSVELFSPNFAGDTKVCNLSSDYKIQPNLCSAGKLTNLPIANIALLAGSCSDDSSVGACQGSYSGGTITLGQSAKVHGNVIAGNVLKTSGDTKVYGSVLAAALGSVGSGSLLDGSTKIDFNGLDDNKTTITLPSKNEEVSDGTSEKLIVKVKWARYI